jgi:hypothetical protein
MTSIRLRARQNREALEEDLNVNRRVFSIEKQQVAMMGEEQPITNPNDESRKDIVEKFVNALLINIERSMNAIALVPLYKSRKAEFLQAVSIVPMTIDWNMISSNYINPSNTQNSRDEMLTNIQSLSSPIQELFKVVNETINYQGTIFFVDTERYGAPMKETFNVIKLLLKLFTLVKLIKDRLFVSNIRPITKGEFDTEFNEIKTNGEEYFSREFADELRNNLVGFNNFLFEGPDDDDESDAFSRTTESSRPDDDPRDNPDDGQPPPPRSSGDPLPREKQEEGEMGSALLTESGLGLPRGYSSSLSLQPSGIEATLGTQGTEGTEGTEEEFQDIPPEEEPSKEEVIERIKNTLDLMSKQSTSAELISQRKALMARYKELTGQIYKAPIVKLAPPKIIVPPPTQTEVEQEDLRTQIENTYDETIQLQREIDQEKDETRKIDLERVRRNKVGTLTRLQMEYRDIYGQNYNPEVEVPASSSKTPEKKSKRPSIFDEPEIDPEVLKARREQEMVRDIPEWISRSLTADERKRALSYAFPEIKPWSDAELQKKLENILITHTLDQLKQPQYIKERVYVEALRKGLKKTGKGKAIGGIRKSNSNNREKLVMKNIRMAKPKELEYDDDRDDNYGNYRLE